MLKGILKYCLLLLFLSGIIQTDSFSQFYTEKSLVLGVGAGPATQYFTKGVNKPAIATQINLCRTVFFKKPGTLVVGGQFSFANLRHESNDADSLGKTVYTSTWSTYMFAARAVYYRQFKKRKRYNFHYYVGLTLGYKFTSFQDNPNLVGTDHDPEYYASLIQDPGRPHFIHFSVFVGLSYHVTPKLSFFLETGFGESYANLGAFLNLNMGTPKQRVVY